MSQNLNAALLLLSLYFSASQPVFADESIMATPENQTIIRDYLQYHPMNADEILRIQQQAMNQIKQLQELSPAEIKELVDKNLSIPKPLRK